MNIAIDVMSGDNAPYEIINGVCTSAKKHLDKTFTLIGDKNLINEYLSELSKGNIPQSLIDEVETLYEDIKHPRDRFELIELIGNMNVDFELSEIQEVIHLVNDFIHKKSSVNVFAKKLHEKITIVDDEDFNELSEQLISICQRFIEGQMQESDFIKCIIEQFDRIKEQYSFLYRNN